MTFCSFVSYSSFNHICKCLDSTANRAILMEGTYTYIYIYICARVCMYVCKYVCVCMYVYIYIYIYIYLSVCVCVYVCVCVCACAFNYPYTFLLLVSFCSFFLGFFCCQEKLSKSINPKQFMSIHFVVHMVCFLVTLGSSATIKSNLSNRSQLRAAKSNPMAFIESVG